jgi:transposase
MAIVTVGIDLAKNVFAVHGVDATGKPVLVRPNVPRGKLLELVASLPPCLIGMEACSGAHHWARLFADFGHTVRLMAPKFVVPYRLSGKVGKNDAADAAAICEAVPLKAVTVRREAMAQLEDLPGWANTVIGDLLSEVTRLDERIAQYDRHIAQIAKASTPARQLMQLPGVGPTTATALVAMIGNGRAFKCGRQLSAWLGLVPGQYARAASSGWGASPRRAIRTCACC